MPVNNFAFNPPDGLANASTYPTKPANETAARQQVQDPLNQVRDFINSTLIPSLYIGAGLTGAIAAVRFAGGTTTGAPTTGTFAKGDFVIDQSGLIWICTVAGTPGTWVKANPRFHSRIALFRGNFSNTVITNTPLLNAGLLPFQFNASEWTTNQFYAEINGGANSGTAASIGLYDLTSSVAVSGTEVTIASNTNALVRTGSFTLTDGHKYGAYIRNSNGSATSFVYACDILSLI